MGYLFFFKQKTAYELRISDWSSDVCSSDLPTLLYCQGGPQGALSQFYSYRWNFQLIAAQGYIVVAPNRRGMPGYGVEWNEQIKIGSASCRERVCQYV